MNYERFVELCNERNVSPTRVVLELGYERSSITRWKASSVANNGMCSLNSSMLLRIAEYFDVSTDYLLGVTNEKKPTSNLSLLDNPRKMLLLDEAEGLTDKSLEQVIRMMRVIKGMQD